MEQFRVGVRNRPEQPAATLVNLVAGQLAGPVLEVCTVVH